MYIWIFIVESDIAKLLEHPYNKYLWDNIPRPFEIIFPKRVHKKADQIAISTREKQIRHHVSSYSLIEKDEIMLSVLLIENNNVFFSMKTSHTLLKKCIFKKIENGNGECVKATTTGP